LLETFLKEKQTDIYEQELLQNASYYVHEFRENWKRAFFGIFGSKAVLTDDSKHYWDKLTAQGRNPVVVIHSGLMSLLKAAGIPCASMILTKEQSQWESAKDPTEEVQAIFDQVWERMTVAGLTRSASKPSVRIFKELPGKSEIQFGAYMDGVCYVNEACVGSRQERYAHLEEIAHHVTGADDESKELQNYLLESLDHFMFESQDCPDMKPTTPSDENITPI
jgi:hypothetical protein